MPDRIQPSEDHFEAEGLLEGLEGEDRQARLDLLSQLAESGVGIEDLKRGAEEDRLATLPLERLFRKDARYTLAEWSELSGLSEDFLRRDLLALGLPRAERDAREYSQQDVEAGKMLRQAVGERFAAAQLESLDLKGIEDAVEVFHLSPRRRG